MMMSRAIYKCLLHIFFQKNYIVKSIVKKIALSNENHSKNLLFMIFLGRLYILLTPLMSAPFDPSKLDLDINNMDTPEKKPEESQMPDAQQEVSSQEIAEEIHDPLAQANPSEQEEASLEESAKQESSEEITEEITGKTEPKEDTSESETEEKKPTDTAVLNDNEILSTDEVVGENITPSDNEEEAKKIIDINISSLQDITHILIDNTYDIMTLEPGEKEVTVTFKKDGIIKSTKYITYPTYTNLLLKIKQVTKITIDEKPTEKEGKWSIQIKDVTYDLKAKVAPSGYGEKVLLKIKENTTKKASKKAKKTSVGTIFGFLWAGLFVSLILGGAFITFIILNAQTVEDVKFFSSLGINLNDINSFISRIVTFIFSIVLFIETSVLAMFLFKFILTKKEFKKKRVLYGMVSTILLIVTFASASAWMIIDGKIKSLPNWQELAYGDIQIYDNDRLTSSAFDKGGSLLTNTENLIGPMTIKYDLSLFESNEEKKGFTVKKYIWNIWNEVIEEINPVLIKDFTEKGNYEISLVVEEVDLRGEIIEKEVDNIPSLSISQVVQVDEEITRNGGKIVKFDASDLQQLGKLEWYFSDDLEKPVWEGYTFKPSQIFFEETVVAMNIINDSQEDIIKVFVIWGETSADIQGQIVSEQSLTNDLEFTLRVQNPETSFGDGFIEEFEWKIWEKTVSKTADPVDLAGSSEIDFTFSKYGKNEVSVILKDSSGKTKEITGIVDIPKKMKLKRPLDIWDGEEKIEDIRYIDKGNEYFVDELGVPTVLKLDARFVRPENLIYSLKEVSWDFDNNNSIDEVGKSAEYPVDIEGNHTVVVNYKFVHRTIPDDIINVKEYIYIEGIKKEAIVSFKIEKDTDYVPVTVRFDASKSTIKNDDIVKFEYDYGDGVVEIRDAINPWHKYSEAWDYTIKLTVTWRSGNKYSAEKKLILKPEPQDVKIGVSIKNAPVGQGIDFSSEDSDGQITEYFWDFGDGNTSVEANPTHAYTKAWTYNVKLRVDFQNSNSLTDETEMNIYEE